MPFNGTSRQSSALGPRDPRTRRMMQAQSVNDLQVNPPLYFDNDGKLSADVADFRCPQTLARRAVASSYQMVLSDELIAVTDTSSARTVTLPDATAMKGRVIHIKDESGGAGTNNITVDGFGSQTVDGAASVTISSNYGYKRVYSTGSAWFSL